MPHTTEGPADTPPPNQPLRWIEEGEGYVEQFKKLQDFAAAKGSVDQKALC